MMLLGHSVGELCKSSILKSSQTYLPGPCTAHELSRQKQSQGLARMQPALRGLQRGWVFKGLGELQLPAGRLSKPPHSSGGQTS